MTARRLVALLAALALARSTPGRCEWQTFDTSDGLVFNYVLCMTIDRDGNYWFGTYAGASRYDGVSWRTFTVADGLPSNRVNDILNAQDGAMWFATSRDFQNHESGGVTRWDGATWRTYTTAEGLAQGVYRILQDRSGSLWFATQARTHRFDGTSWTTPGPGGVNAMYEDRAGNLWFGTRWGGALRFDGTTWTAYTQADGLADDYVRCIAQDRDGPLWFGTSNGVSRFDGSTWRTYNESDGIVDDYVNSILVDRSGILWFGTGEYDTQFAGAWRFDGTRFTCYKREDGLAANVVTSILQDRAGNLWFGTTRGASRYDQAEWKTYLVAPFVGRNRVRGIAQDREGDIWVGLGVESSEWDPGGAARFDGVNWTHFRGGDGLASDDVRAVLADRAGGVWFGTNVGLSRFDGTSWRTYTTADGLESNRVEVLAGDRYGYVWAGRCRRDSTAWTCRSDLPCGVSAMLQDRRGSYWFGLGDCGVSVYDGVTWRRDYPLRDVTSILEDRRGRIWFASGPVSCFDGVFWTFYRQSDGLAADGAFDIEEDRSGNLWFATPLGVSRYDGLNWRTYTTADGLAENWVNVVLADQAGNLWFGTENGVSVHQPDRIPPLTVFLNKPGQLLASRQVSVTFVPAFQESGIEFSHALDAEPWSDWSPLGFYNRSALPDGSHTLRVRARDRDFNVEPAPAVWAFEIDATPPAPVIESPSFGQPVRGTVAIRGRAADARFEAYRVEARASGTTTWDSTQVHLLAHGTEPVVSGVVATWNTTLVPDGVYEVRLAVLDSLKLLGSYVVEVVVDNEPPGAEETAPVVLRAAAGGHVYTTRGDVHLYFPPRSFARDVVVTIAALADSQVPEQLPDGARRVSPGFRLAWSNIPLEKPAVLELSDPTADPDAAPHRHVVYGSDDGATWRSLGGSQDGGKLAVSLRAPGRYAVFLGGERLGAPGLSAIIATPRVFSPRGSFANDRVAIAFELGQSAPVTIRIYNRAGRIVRELLTGHQLVAGSNLVWWDGRSSDGEPVPGGLYVVSAEALGRRSTQTLAVVE